MVVKLVLAEAEEQIAPRLRTKSDLLLPEPPRGGRSVFAVRLNRVSF